jgi:nitrate reductase assembly molybdenum cofactor insertion protein NarJ
MKMKIITKADNIKKIQFSNIEQHSIDIVLNLLEEVDQQILFNDVCVDDDERLKKIYKKLFDNNTICSFYQFLFLLSNSNTNLLKLLKG